MLASKQSVPHTPRSFFFTSSIRRIYPHDDMLQLLLCSARLPHTPLRPRPRTPFVSLSVAWLDEISHGLWLSLEVV